MNESKKEHKNEKHTVTKRSFFFNKCPDELVLMILSYGTMEDIESTRTWQTEKVQKWTETRSMEEAAKNNNLYNMKWIYGYSEGTVTFTRVLTGNWETNFRY